MDEDRNLTVAALLATGSLALVHRSVDENLLTGELTESIERYSTDPPFPPESLLLDADQRNLYAASSDGRLAWWRLDEGSPEVPQVVETGRGAITELGLLIGDRSLVVGYADGLLEIWFPVRNDDESFTLTAIREFVGLGGAVRHIAPSLRDKGFLAADDSGNLGLFYSTSRRTLWEGSSPVRSTDALYFAPRADGAFVAGPEGLVELLIDNPHPEVGLRALFGKVWYEGYSEPAYVWQSTGGTDDFESKLSMTPLMVGTLKGTLYSLFLAIPLGVLGAMYTSQFMHHSLKRYVKPTVEIMAALPSVVLGFLAGLWLAPRVEQIMPALLLMAIVVPAFVVIAGLLWRKLPLRIRGAFPDGVEALLQVGVVALGLWVCLSLNRGFESLVFGGSFQDWLLDTTGLAYDQRNAVVVGLAMGFAVIPIIFSIAEDAFSNVPRNLVSGSLALGASRWQTVTRIVLPSASPGIFSAIMIGFGRAVGETMIVLMATGNTPIMDWNPFNGFRTLSANIAVEIPEAPQGATLYRTLFLAALILFLFTFVTNTLAELIRQRLRKRYAQL
jgi:phosphate transport system permease protein